MADRDKRKNLRHSAKEAAKRRLAMASAVFERMQSGSHADDPANPVLDGRERLNEAFNKIFEVPGDATPTERASILADKAKVKALGEEAMLSTLDEDLQAALRSSIEQATALEKRGEEATKKLMEELHTHQLKRRAQKLGKDASYHLLVWAQRFSKYKTAYDLGACFAALLTGYDETGQKVGIKQGFDKIEQNINQFVQKLFESENLKKKLEEKGMDAAKLEFAINENIEFQYLNTKHLRDMELAKENPDYKKVAAYNKVLDSARKVRFKNKMAVPVWAEKLGLGRDRFVELSSGYIKGMGATAQGIRGGNEALINDILSDRLGRRGPR